MFKEISMPWVSSLCLHKIYYYLMFNHFLTIRYYFNNDTFKNVIHDCRYNYNEKKSNTSVVLVEVIIIPNSLFKRLNCKHYNTCHIFFSNLLKINHIPIVCILLMV